MRQIRLGVAFLEGPETRHVIGYVMRSIARVLSFLGRVKLREKNGEEAEQAKKS